MVGNIVFWHRIDVKGLFLIRWSLWLHTKQWIFMKISLQIFPSFFPLLSISKYFDTKKIAEETSSLGSILGWNHSFSSSKIWALLKSWLKDGERSSPRFFLFLKKVFKYLFKKDDNLNLIFWGRKNWKNILKKSWFSF